MKPVVQKLYILYKLALTCKITNNVKLYYFYIKSYILNRALPTPYKINSGLINIDAPLIGGVQVESGISVSTNNTFSASFYLVDAISKLAIPNPGWDVRIHSIRINNSIDFKKYARTSLKTYQSWISDVFSQ